MKKGSPPDKFADSGDAINQMFTPIRKPRKAKIAEKIDSLVRRLKSTHE